MQNGEDEVTSVTDFCQEFVEAPIHLQTLVRLSGPPIDCPFTGEFTFTYKTGTALNYLREKAKVLMIYVFQVNNHVEIPSHMWIGAWMRPKLHLSLPSVPLNRQTLEVCPQLYA